MAPETFDAIFSAVPRAQKWALQRFWLECPPTERLVGGTPWRYVATGEGRRTLLLLPDALSAADSWSLLVRALQGEFRLLIPDGYALQGIYDMDRFCEGLVQLIESEGAYAATVIAHGTGGSAAQALQSRFPHRVQHLVLCHSAPLEPGAPLPFGGGGPVLDLAPWALVARRLMRELAPGMPPDGERLAYTEAYLQLMIQDLDRATLQRMLRTERMARLDLGADDKGLQAWPGTVLAITSDDDPLSVESLDSYRERYPRVQACSLDAGGHWAHLLYPDLVAQRIRRFLSDRPY